MRRRLAAPLQVHRLQLLRRLLLKGLLSLNAALWPGPGRLRRHGDRLGCGCRLPTQYCRMPLMLRM
jgi:hypothetical protein